MGRLIDADKLRIVIHRAYSDDLEILDKIDEAETVSAIPVEWIQRYINACEMVSVMDGGAVTKWSADAVKAMLECWREEQLPTCGPDYCEIGGQHD
jgi:hypothetical protein